MKINQVYEIVNSVVRQMSGLEGVTATNLSGLIQLGDSVMDSGNESFKDNFLNTLVDRIGRTIISARAYSPDIKAALNDAFTFGAIMQKIYVQPLDAEQSTTWGLANGAGVDQYVIKKPTTKQKLFSAIDTWQVMITIPDVQLRSAFQSESTMAAFIDAIFMSMQNSIENQLEAMLNMCYVNFIGEKYKAATGIYKIDLLTMYNALTDPAGTMTAAQALNSQDFLRFAVKTINLYTRRFEKMNDIFNCEGYRRFTPKEYQRVTMLNDFESAVIANLQSNTYHDELVQLPLYNTVPYWQGSGTTYDFANVSKIDITTSSGTVETVSNIICLMTDFEALGITMDNRRSKSAYNASGEYTNYFEKADMGYFNDMSEQGLVFTLN